MNGVAQCDVSHSTVMPGAVPGRREGAESVLKTKQDKPGRQETQLQDLDKVFGRVIFTNIFQYPCYIKQRNCIQ